MDLKPTKVDRAASLAKSIVGAAPVVGPLISEVVSNLIPNQRIDRISEFVTLLNARVESLDDQLLQSAFRDEHFVDLLEDGFQSASRALSRERKEYIASLIANSLTEEQIEHSQAKLLLSLLAELSDPEIVLLQFYAKLTSDDQDEYLETHKAIIQGPVAHMGSSPQELDQHALHSTYKVHLERLGLIKPHFRHARRGEFPEFDDKTGMMKVSYHGVTMLGRLLLRFIDLDDGMRREE
jgi:outer membrane murein-binding lipoprotein Lpp